MSSRMVNMLIIAFNRPDCVEKLIAPLLIAKPAKLFVALDGPRKHNEDDVVKCRAVRKLIESANWECKVEYLISNVNCGCSDHIEKAINWFFDRVDEGVILEDDCIPHPSFLNFSHELLHRYRNDERVYLISGISFLPLEGSKTSYRFSRLVNIWGWATWKRAWSHLIGDLSNWPELKMRRIMECYGTEEASQVELVQECYEGKRESTWGVRWRLTCLSKGAFSVAPVNNFVQNIGFNRNDSSSKTFYHPIMDIKASSVSFPLIHPEEVTADIRLDEGGLRFYYESAKNH